MTGNDDTAGEDKRRFERRPVVLRVDYDGAEDLLADYTENLSGGGIFVVTHRELAVGTDIRLVLSFPGLLQPIHVEGVVRWTRGRGGDEDPGIGIEFEDPAVRSQLEQIITRLRAGDPRLTQRVVRILLVEDNPHVADLIREGLRGSSKRSLGADLTFEFREAHNGREAIDLIKAERFDAMIVDIYLPVIDGSQVIAHVRQDPSLREVPVIAVSAGGEHARAAALGAGADIFIDKPMRLRQVIETIRTLMKL